MNQTKNFLASANVMKTAAVAWVLLLLLCGPHPPLAAQPALTNIQDILYKADGTRFNGTVTIQWTPFLSGNSTFIPQQTLTVDVVNGVFRAKLVPTTNASPGANYEVTFRSQGRFLFTETWAVPMTTNILKVRDVRVTTGTVIGNPPVFGQLAQISDIEGLENELLLRPMRGFNFALGRAAMINSTGGIDGVQGNLSDCVRVDGSAAPCGTGGGGVGSSVGFVDNEAPAGLINGSNATFTLLAAPQPAASLMLHRNGLRLRAGVDFTLSGQTITFLSQSLPQSGDSLLASYRTFVSGGGGGGSPAGGPQLLCAGTGGSTGASTTTELGSCTIAAGYLQQGDRIEIQFGYNHVGTAVAPRFTIRWGASDVASRNLSASETTLIGTVNLSLGASNAIYIADSRGFVSTSNVSTGTANDALSSGITVSLRGHLASTSATESMNLRYYSVIRHPVTAP